MYAVQHVQQITQLSYFLRSQAARLHSSKACGPRTLIHRYGGLQRIQTSCDCISHSWSRYGNVVTTHAVVTECGCTNLSHVNSVLQIAMNSLARVHAYRHRARLPVDGGEHDTHGVKTAAIAPVPLTSSSAKESPTRSASWMKRSSLYRPRYGSSSRRHHLVAGTGGRLGWRGVCSRTESKS